MDHSSQSPSVFAHPIATALASQFTTKPSREDRVSLASHDSSASEDDA